MITAIAIDDEQFVLDIISAFCKKTDLIDLKKCFTETAAALEYLKRNKVDLLFLDINILSMSGGELQKKLPKDIMVIYITASRTDTAEGFNIDAIDYLLKPIEFDRFLQAVNKVSDYFTYIQRKDVPAHLSLRVNYSTVKVALNEIIYIEGLDNYLKIHLENKKALVVRMSLKDMIAKLSQKDFLRIHRSYIISVNRVTSVRNKLVYLNNISIPVGPSYLHVLKQLM